jgi:hypothetical protein
MSLVADVRMYTRFASGLPALFKGRLTIAEARAIVEERMDRREANFLQLVERSVFGYPKSPYRPLMDAAGCTFGDLQQMTRSHGLETTLQRLRDAGVFITFEEFKGRRAIERNGLRYDVAASAFDNPFLTRHYYAETGGTTGAGTRVPLDCNHLSDRLPYVLLAYHAHGVLGAPTAVWRGILPDNSGISNFLRGPMLGHVPEKWFTPVTRRDLRPRLRNRLATSAIRAVARAYGLHIPRPEPVRLDEPLRVAKWASDAATRHGRALVRASVSLAVRAAVSAREAGLNMQGVALMGGGEPPTPAKVRAIEASGARWIPMYAFTEGGRAGVGCVHPADGNDLHFLKDALALIQHARTVKDAGIEVPAFYFTSLLASSPKILINVENDDYGMIEQRRCGCALEEYGFTDHLRHVRSFRKLTGEGMTLVGTEMERILGELLPARFGGGPLDYQLLEEEDERGLTRLTLLVHPAIRPPSDQAVIDAVLDELGRGNDAADIARAHWRQAKTLRVKRAAPIWTGRGKLMPLHLAERGRPHSSGAAGRPGAAGL